MGKARRLAMAASLDAGANASLAEISAERSRFFLGGMPPGRRTAALPLEDWA
jgi:hypothetical protein